MQSLIDAFLDILENSLKIYVLTKYLKIEECLKNSISSRILQDAQDPKESLVPFINWSGDGNKK